MRVNMNRYTAMTVCAVFAAAALTGCAADSRSVSVADFGQSGGISYTSDTAPRTEPEVQQSSSVTFSGTVTSTKKETSAAESTAEDTSQDVTHEQTETSTHSEASESEEKTDVTEYISDDNAAPDPVESTIVTTASTTAQTTSEPAVAEPEYDFDSRAYTALNYSEVKGVWISYIELAELLSGQSAGGFRSNIGAVFDNCVSLGINTVYVHVRSHSDAYYRSEIFPWARNITGTLGADPGFDPLQIMLEEAHSRNISFQAWINPLRACSASQLSSYGSYPVYSFAAADGMAGKYAVDVNGTYFLNPAYEAVTELIAAGAAEIVSGYDVDGLHIDDYFYPTTDTSFDSSAFSDSGYTDLSDFRFANCDRMVEELYGAVKSANPSAVFSVSVQGRIENNYTQLYADVRKWCTESGYLDIMIPQIYYGFENSAAPYQATLDEWDELAEKGGIPLVAGLSVSKSGIEDKWAGSGKNEWIDNNDIISRQLAAAKKCASYGGFALYSYRSIFSPESSVSAAVNKEISALKDII